MPAVDNFIISQPEDGVAALPLYSVSTRQSVATIVRGIGCSIAGGFVQRKLNTTNTWVVL